MKTLRMAVTLPLYEFSTTTSSPNNNFRALRRRSANSPPALHEKDDRSMNGKKHMMAKQIVKDSDEFFIAASNLKEKLLRALRPLEQVNDPFTLTNIEDDGSGLDIVLDLGPVIGQYYIQFDMEQSLLMFRSPISGQIAYNLTKSGEWCSDQDGHNFEGLLVRDLIRQIKGVPDL